VDLGKGRRCAHCPRVVTLHCLSTMVDMPRAMLDMLQQLQPMQSDDNNNLGPFNGVLAAARSLRTSPVRAPAPKGETKTRQTRTQAWGRRKVVIVGSRALNHNESGMRIWLVSLEVLCEHVVRQRRMIVVCIKSVAVRPSSGCVHSSIDLACLPRCTASPSQARRDSPDSNSFQGSCYSHDAVDSFWVDLFSQPRLL